MSEYVPGGLASNVVEFVSGWGSVESGGLTYVMVLPALVPFTVLKVMVTLKCSPVYVQYQCRNINTIATGYSFGPLGHSFHFLAVYIYTCLWGHNFGTEMSVNLWISLYSLLFSV